MSGQPQYLYAAPLVMLTLIVSCAVAPSEPEGLGLDSGQGGRPTYGTPREQGLVQIYDEEDIKKKVRPRGGDLVKANHSPVPLPTVNVDGTTPASQPTPAGPPTLVGASLLHAAPGTKVTISGSNFGTDKAAVKVVFTGDKEATIATIANGSLEVNVPEGATDGPIKVTVGTTHPTVTSAFPFDVHGAKAPTVTKITPENGKAGDTITIEGTNFGTVKTNVAVEFGTTSAPLITEVLDTKITVQAPEAFTTGPITVKVTDPATQKTDGAVSPQTFTKQS